MNILEKLFGSAARVRLLRLFLMNPEDVFDIPEIVRRSKIDTVTVRRELKLLEDIEFIKSREVTRTFPGRSKKSEPIKKKVTGFAMNYKFPHIAAFRGLMTDITLGKEDVVARFRNVGKVKLIITAGVFLDKPESRVDILIVGDQLRKSTIEGVLRRLEAELGKELTYGIMETVDFEYRYGIYDKFIRDIIDYPHQIAFNKLNILQ